MRKKKPATTQDVFYKSIPALANYIDRIGAEQLNFRRFMVKEFKAQYYTEKCLIKVMPDGTIWCSDKAYAPREDEAKQIQGALMAAKFPKHIFAKSLLQLKDQLTGEPYEFLDRKTGEIQMVQERIQLKSGDKAYIPWTFYDDGVWRRMEPEGDLPFFKPKEKRSNFIMIHEGAKSAKFVDDLIRTPSKLREHPWGDWLKDFDHWGIIGGALAPHRAKYEELVAEKPHEIVYICDNDWAGREMLKQFSLYYGGRLKGIFFDDRWPPGFDLADDFPEEFFNGKRYIGPMPESMLKAATRATDLVPNPSGKGRPIITLRQPFKEEWFHTINPEVYIHKDNPNMLFDADGFNSFVKPFSHAEDTARLLRSDVNSKGIKLKYDPSFPPGLYNGDKYPFFNTFAPTSIKPEKGDAKPFLDFMEMLIEPEEDRLEVLKWCATLIGRPEIRMLYGMLLISETQGVGKGTLGEKILAPLVGMENVSFPGEKEIVDSAFNYWIAHKRLAIVHEIYSGHSAKGYNTLKTIITDKNITVSKKYQANYEIENWLHIFACSNSLRALHMSLDDRRWLVPKVTERKQTGKYWDDLNYWLNFENGLGKILHWAREYSKKNYVKRSDPSPMTSMKQEVIDEAMSPGMHIVSQLLAYIKEKKIEGFILDIDLVTLIQDQLYGGKPNDKLERPLTLRRLAKSMGFSIHPKRASLVEWHCIGVGAKLVCTSTEWDKFLPSEMLAAGLKPLKVAELWAKISPC